MHLFLRWTMKPDLEASDLERYCPNNVGENVVIQYGRLALPPSRPLFPSATETVKQEGPSSLSFPSVSVRRIP